MRDWTNSNARCRTPAANWQLATGNWRLTTGDWQLATGNWRLATGDWQLLSLEHRPPLAERRQALVRVRRREDLFDVRQLHRDALLDRLPLAAIDQIGREAQRDRRLVAQALLRRA